MPELCFVTTCMGRLSFLKQTLPRLVAQPHSNCIVVDYSCPERCGDWVEATFPQVKVVRVEGQTTFNLGRASNAGIQAADAAWLCCIDCDILVDPDFVPRILPHLQPGHYYRADRLEDAGIWGTFLSERETVLRVGSYDEVYQGWGDLDVDLYAALDFANITKRTFPASLLHHLPHNDAARVRFFEHKDRWRNWLINRFYRIIKFDLMRLRGTPLPQPRREDLYQRVAHLVLTALARGSSAEITVACALDAHTPEGLGLERLLKYTLPRQQPPR
jgi:glycosyltransferase involved in cell wall biosynthesis